MSFRTDVATMHKAATNVDDTNNEVQIELKRLRGVVQGTTGSWKGDAQGAFHNMMERWDTSARDLSEALRSIADNIRHNAGSFSTTDSENADSMH
ncbi:MULTISPECIES: WXG100 family type VII secretion target [Corynebacterium]|uniref:ESAT-6-like protein n=1 Tax=Corynebacterium auriscanis TaxID=99807 RepID=A0A0A2DIB1_9CORY|nr:MULTISPECIES: WXG100 family type VII secretion target [Corynebacterium]KGM18908.1 CFP-10-like protein [Corynebacterium auriscanis]MCX2162789.1 WXG100 family type VII secretion target [Corynebacterium auriscanis]OFT88724.1 hypothetical protein HMPREF3098_07845 [Corynebacterium sp. HMSC28B08]WJY73512.1 WXG domain conatining protein [Corynebacterium auriscanis]